ncbi:MAG: DUF6265 family protein [Pyrinomonadaceae bacterium]
MKSSIRFHAVVPLAFAFTLMIVWSARVTQTRAAGTPPRIAELAWISGDWQTAAGGRAQIEEHWTLPAGGTMIGMGRTVVGDKTVEFEFLRIEQRGDDIFYVAHPNANCPQTDFKLTRLSGREAVFENPEHDFPKRVIYRKNSRGSLIASVDAGAGTKAQTFSYVRIGK